MKKFYFSLLFASFGLFAQTGSLCTDPIVINGVPFSTSDNTANYADNYDPPTATAIACGAGTLGNYYLGGNDVIYSFTAEGSGTINLEIPSAVGWTGMFVYTSCAGIGEPPYACNCSSAAGNRTISNMAVTAGETYYIVISSWPTPQTIAYTLNITGTLGVADTPQSKSLKLYPNPVTNILNVDTDEILISASIITVNGQRLTTKLNGNQINVENLQQGFYVLEAITEDGVTVHKNFVKN